MGSAISSTAIYGRQQFYFDSDVNLTAPPRHGDCIMTNYELRQLLQNKVDDVSEKIQEVSYYTHPLNTWQMTKYLLHHAFIVLKTDKWWWSIEKTKEASQFNDRNNWKMLGINDVENKIVSRA